jgi:hypothetical protein
MCVAYPWKAYKANQRMTAFAAPYFGDESGKESSSPHTTSQYLLCDRGKVTRSDSFNHEGRISTYDPVTESFQR